MKFKSIKTSIMADAAAARREARRKRILENSHNRLQLISGKTDDDSFKNLKGSPSRIISHEEDDKIPLLADGNIHSWNCSNNGSIVAVLESLESLSSSYQLDSAAGGDEVTIDSSNPVSPVSAVKELQLPLSEKIIIYQYDIVLLSLLIQLFHSLISLGETTYFFLPIVIYSVTKMICFPQKSDSRIANALRLMNHFSSSRVQSIIQITQYIGALFSDICVFLFVTICSQSVYITWKDSLLT